MGLSPLSAGIFLIPISAAIALLGPVSGYLSDTYGPRFFSTAGLLVSSAGMVLLANIGRTITFWQLALPLSLVGAGIGLFQSPNRASVMSSVPAEQRGLAAGTATTVFITAASFSLSLAFFILTRGVPIVDLQTIFVGGTAQSGAPWVGSFIDSIHTVYYLSTAFLLIGVVPSVLRGRHAVNAEVKGPVEP